MNIFITQTAYPPSVGGAQTHFHHLGQQLAKRHSVRVASFWNSTRTDWLLGTTWFAPTNDPYEIDSIPVSPLRYSRTEKVKLSPWVVGYYPMQTLSIHKIAATLLPKLRQAANGADLIHHGRVGREPLAFASLALARERHIPFVLTPYHHLRWRGWLYRNYHRLYREADAVMALTPAEVETLVDLGVPRERIFISGSSAVLEDTFDAEGFRQKYGLTGPIVLFLGQKYAYKGLAQILKAAPLVWKEHPNTHFVFIGPRTTYSRLTFRRVNDSRILELDVVSLFEKTSALAACDLLCVPSTQECFGGVYIEAWKMGKPVIGADIPAVATVISDGVDGFLVPSDHSLLAEKILVLLANPALRDQMGAAGRLKSETHFTWPILANRLEDVYLQLTGQTPSVY